jgi:hypothetical protein
MRFILQLKGNEDDLENFIRIRIESRFYETFVQNSWAQRLFNQEFFRCQKREKEWLYIWRK